MKLQRDMLKIVFRTQYDNLEFLVMPFEINSWLYISIINWYTHEPRRDTNSLCVSYFIKEVQFLRLLLRTKAINVDHSMLEARQNWEAPKMPTNVCQFLGHAGYYRRFIENFSMLAKLLTKRHEARMGWQTSGCVPKVKTHIE